MTWYMKTWLESAQGAARSVLRDSFESYARPRVIRFFSIRRRHTSCLSDWSSDVCSSDLVFRKYFDADQRRLREHRLDGLVTAQHAEVEDAKLVGAYADALLREHTNVPIALPVPKPD